MDIIALLPMILLIAGFYFLYRRTVASRRRVHDQLERETLDALEVVGNPDTDPSILRQYLVMPIPHDETYEYHMEILRTLASNPALPPELQAAAVNRISNEEVSARLDKTLKKRGGSGSKGFIGFSQEISGE